MQFNILLIWRKYMGRECNPMDIQLNAGKIYLYKTGNWRKTAIKELRHACYIYLKRGLFKTAKQNKNAKKCCVDIECKEGICHN